MRFKRFHFIEKWFRSSKDRMGLDFLLAQAPASTVPLRERLNWLTLLVKWTRTKGTGATKLPVARLKYILQILDRNPKMKAQVAETLRSIIHDTSALELFMSIGIPNEEGFFGEFLERLQSRLLPQPPHDNDLISVFSETFRFTDDVHWIRRMEPALFQEWINLFNFSEGTIDPGWNTLIRDAREAITLLSYQVRSLGLSRMIRQRRPNEHFTQLPFSSVPERVSDLLKASSETETITARENLKVLLDQCFEIIRSIHRHFSEQGASIFQIYQIIRLEALIFRVKTLAGLISDHKANPQIIQRFMCSLIYENARSRSFKALFEDNVALISQKIIETNAETGEHYITRDKKEYFIILRKALGGGFITGFTILFKFNILQLKVAPFISGLLQSLNYALSFLLLQATGFTLATKQPAMTATVIAQKIPEPEGTLTPLIDEMSHLIRSQLATVSGNLWGVIPTVVAIELVFTLFHSHMTDVAYAEHTIESFSILGNTPFYAAITGVLLWLSSVFAGWFYNWFCFRGLPEAIEHHSRLVYVFGAHRTEKIAAFLKRNMAGFASNISLGFLLGMTPQLGAFFGLPLDVRHVTLSTGSMAASAWIIGSEVFHQWSFWLGLLGLLSMAVLNIAVSFGLALTVAIWAKRSGAPKLHVIYGALLKRFLTKPWSFFLPTGQLVESEVEVL